MVYDTGYKIDSVNDALRVKNNSSIHSYCIEKKQL